MKAVERWFKIAIGVIVVIIGLILMPVPGPGGTPVTLFGLAILSSELPIAKRVREWFLAWRAKHYETASPWKRCAIVTTVLALYVVMTWALYKVWVHVRS